MRMSVQFMAEVVEVKVRKLSSGDKMVRVVLETDQETALELQKAIAQYPVQVEVTEHE